MVKADQLECSTGQSLPSAATHWSVLTNERAALVSFDQQIEEVRNFLRPIIELYKKLLHVVKLHTFAYFYVALITAFSI